MTVIMNEDAVLAVKRGAYWLDENHPGWVRKINLASLDMKLCNTCVIGQAVGDYYDTIRGAVTADHDDSIGADEWAVENGFCSPGVYGPEVGSYRSYREVDDAYYGALETLWTEEVRKRLG